MSIEKISKNDFIELEFTGRISDTGEVFDSNIKKDLEKINSSQASKTKPFVFCLGHEMFLKKIEEFLIEKEIGKTYEIKLEPEDAFGKRDLNLIKIVPEKLFAKQNTKPQQGMLFNFDNQLGKILSVSGGRIRVDFNNPLAGKPIEYNLKPLKKITDKNKQIKSLIEFFFRREFDFKIIGKKLIIQLKKQDAQFENFLQAFKDKFRKMLDLDLEVEVIAEKSETKDKNNK